MQVTLPRFAPSSASKPSEATKSSGEGKVETTNDGAPSDPLDFDLLAEYLLDDGAASAAASGFGLGTAFDFSVDVSAPQSGVVSPEDPSVGNADPLADAAAQLKQTQQTSGASDPKSGDLAGDLAQVQQMIAAHANAAQQRIDATVAAPAPAVHVVTPAAPDPAVTSTPTPPAVSSHPGMPLPPAPAPFPAIPTPAPATLAPAPAIPLSAVGTPLVAAPPVVVHHHGTAAAAAAAAAAGNKRRRADTLSAALPPPAISGFMHVNGQLVRQPPSQRGGRQKSQAQIDRRRERNRILARRTRLRKKFFFESLQKDVSDLQRENGALKDIVRSKLSAKLAKAVLEECDVGDKLPSCVSETVGEGGAELDRRDFNLIQSVQKSQQCFVITDPSLQDNPIVYASDDFLSLTGYSRDEVLGRNCRFLQGTETSPGKVETIRKAIANGEDVSVCFINYTADGTAFWNKLFIAALRDAQNNIVNFIGVIVKVAAPEPGDPEAGKRLPGEVSQEESDEQFFDGATKDRMAGPDSGTVYDAAAAKAAAEGTVMAIEGAVSAAVAAAPAVAGASAPASS